MSQDLKPGDFLVYQLESAVALLRVLDIDEIDGQRVWHLAAYSEFFPDVEAAENAIDRSELLTAITPTSPSPTVHSKAPRSLVSAMPH